MAHKKAGGSTRNGRDSNPKYLGVKKYGDEHVIPGNIIIRQRGTKVHPGTGVGMGRDYTIFAIQEGKVSFRQRAGGRMTVIANAPNPAGFAILKGSFDEGAISPLWLAVAAAPPTLVAIANRFPLRWP